LKKYTLREAYRLNSLWQKPYSFTKTKATRKMLNHTGQLPICVRTSKVFEKLIIKRIQKIQDENECDITGQNQHGFKCKRSTSTLSSQLQSIIARALDEDRYMLLASLDLSSAFDIVNVGLLIKRLKIMGMPGDVIELINVWLNKRTYYVNIDRVNSVLFDLLLGIVQGSILGPVLYKVFVSLLFDLEFMLAFADDNFLPKISLSKTKVVIEMERALDRISKWLTDSGLKVNNYKTELCLFS
jgi:hypothetical protein